MPPARRAPSERFWRHVSKSDGCWLWTGRAQVRGYGVINLNTRTQLAHRFSWELHRGSIPAGLFVCHRCDVPLCVNPDHLFLGTQVDNMADFAAKGRWRPRATPIGSAVKTATHTEAEIAALKRDHLNGIDRKELANRYRMSKTMVGSIVRGIWWKHVLAAGA